MASSKWIFIVNPKAGGTRLGESWEKLCEKLTDLGVEFDSLHTSKKGDGTLLVQRAIQQGYRKIIGVGGDGTNNEIINGIFSQDIVNTNEISYSLFPFGTGNDWARTHNISHHPVEWVKMLKAGNAIHHNIGIVRLRENDKTIERFFINIAGMAYDAHIVKKVEDYPYKLRRKVLYLWLVLKHLINYSSPLLKIYFNEEERKHKYYTVNCGICYYSGGGMRLVPQADPVGQHLGLTMIKEFPKWRAPFDSPKLFSGNLKNHKYTEMCTSQVVKVEALGNDVLEVEVDGEYVGTGSVEIFLATHQLKVIVP